MSFKDIIRFLLGELLEKETVNPDYRQKVNRQLMETWRPMAVFLAAES